MSVAATTTTKPAATAAAAPADAKAAAAALPSLVPNPEMKIERLPCGAVVIRQFLSAAQQHDVYVNELYTPSIGSIEQKKLTNPNAPKPMLYVAVNALCIAVWRNLFTKRSNITEPKRLFAAVNHAIAEARKAPVAVGSAAVSESLVLPASWSVDNLYAQLYPAGGKAIPHTDAFLDFVASLSFGDACEFRFDEQKNTPLKHSVTLWSGDLLLINGGALQHSVESIIPGSAPEYWTGKPPTVVPDAKHLPVAAPAAPAAVAAAVAPAAASGSAAGAATKLERVETFGLSRCNIQMREFARTSKDTPANWGDYFKVEDN